MYEIWIFICLIISILAIIEECFDILKSASISLRKDLK